MAKTTFNKKQLFFVNSPVRKTRKRTMSASWYLWPLRSKHLPVNGLHWNATFHRSNLAAGWSPCWNSNPPIIESSHLQKERSKGLSYRIVPPWSKYSWNLTSLELSKEPCETLWAWNRKPNTMTWLLSNQTLQIFKLMVISGSWWYCL